MRGKKGQGKSGRNKEGETKGAERRARREEKKNSILNKPKERRNSVREG